MLHQSETPLQPPPQPYGGGVVQGEGVLDAPGGTTQVGSGHPSGPQGLGRSGVEFQWGVIGLKEFLKHNFPLVLAAIGSLASVWTFIMSGDNDAGRTLALAVHSSLAFIGFYAKAREDTPALPELVLIFGFLAVLIHLFTPPSVLTVLAQTSCMFLLAFMSNKTKHYFTTKPRLSVVLLFVPLSMFTASFMMMMHLFAYNALSDFPTSFVGTGKVAGTFEIRGSMLLANIWEEQLRLGSFLSGVSSGWLSGLLWASGHTLPEAAKAGELGVEMPVGKEHIFNLWVGLAFLAAITASGAILFYILRLTDSFWNVFLIHVLMNLFGFSISVGPSIKGLLLSSLFFTLSIIWLIFHLRYCVRDKTCEGHVSERDV